MQPVCSIKNSTSIHLLKEEVRFNDKIENLISLISSTNDRNQKANYQKQIKDASGVISQIKFNVFYPKEFDSKIQNPVVTPSLRRENAVLAVFHEQNSNLVEIVYF